MPDRPDPLETVLISQLRPERITRIGRVGDELVVLESRNRLADLTCLRGLRMDSHYTSHRSTLLLIRLQTNPFLEPPSADDHTPRVRRDKHRTQHPLPAPHPGLMQAHPPIDGDNTLRPHGCER